MEPMMEALTDDRLAVQTATTKDESSVPHLDMLTELPKDEQMDAR